MNPGLVPLLICGRAPSTVGGDVNRLLYWLSARLLPRAECFKRVTAAPAEPNPALPARPKRAFARWRVVFTGTVIVPAAIIVVSGGIGDVNHPSYQKRA